MRGSPFFMRTTIEVFNIQIKNKDGFVDFASDPDIFDLLSDNDNGFVSHVDKNRTGDVPHLQRTVRIPANEINEEGDTVKYHHKSISERYICGIIETGAYGKEYEIANKDTPQDVAYTVGKEQAIIKPFFYYLKIPRKGHTALLILERTDNEGIYPLMNILLTTFFRDLLGADKLFKIEKSNIILSSYLKELSSGRYKSITLTSNKHSTDLCDSYGGGLESTDYTMELTVKFKNKLGFDKEEEIRNLINSGKSLFVMPELNDIFEDANRKVVTSIGTGKQAKTRTYYLNKEQKDLVRPYYDIEVDANDKNFSDYVSIKKMVRNFIQDHSEFDVFD